MFRRAFQPPLLKKPADSLGPDLIDASPAKRQRLSLNDENEEAGPSPAEPPLKRLKIISTAPRPLSTVRNPPAVGNASLTAEGTPSGYYTVLWRNRTTKKHKTWDGDGVLSVAGGYASLQDVSGKHMGRSMFDSPLLPGSTLSVAGKDVEIDAHLSKNDFLAGTPFSRPLKPIEPPVEVKKPKPPPKAAVREIKAESFYRPLNAATKAAKHQFRSPLLSSSVLPKPNATDLTPRHDPDQAGALVMDRPKSVPPGKQIVDVVVDPILCKRLRAHQREGVKFMYECVMGMRPYEGQGAILADEMGLGKTLQTIALIWTLLKQNPVHEAPPVIKKALIVCPVTLIDNWRKEFRKWLGSERLGVFVADGTNMRLRDFTVGKSYSVMIIGYEKLRTVQEELKQGAGIDLVVADEGHRLKTAQNKSAQAIRSLNTQRRIILSGTPIQNDLSEFFAMVDFVNSGLLKTYSAFRKEFEGPIVKSQQPGAQKKDVEEGEMKSKMLAAVTKPFILRRTAELLSKYLQPKTEYVLFCRPSTVQADVYRAVLSSPVFSRVLGSPEASLQLITLLKKVCNSPSLLTQRASADAPANSNVATLLASIPPSLIRARAAASSAKLGVLDRLLHHLRTTTQEKIVLVSHYTSTLDLLQTHLSANGYHYLRLDGSTPPSKRQDLVDTFNRTPASVCFAFLLSAKAGGVGLNLIGASRLVLFDVDWNPSTELQAMARIHRDGQKRPVRIYRLLVAGALDEKVWQRQVTKMGLADSVMDQKGGSGSKNSFSLEELRDLFTLDTESTCQTHDLSGCGCGGRGKQRSAEYSADDASTRTESDDDDDDLPAFPTLIKASQLALDPAQRPRDTPKRKGKMQALMHYAHLDTTSHIESAGSGALIDDDAVLEQVLDEPGNRVKYVFSKTSK
ncbi:MAG: helicase [Thelocarpon impressellum]|nr:MAG: helicase [Thelocarpon impressellum]